MNKIMNEQELLACFDDAINFGHIFVTYQPKINHSTGRMIGAEALMRWNDPVNGMQYPSDFIPVLESSDLIYKADLYVFDCVCRFQRKMLDKDIPSVPISFNMSRHDIIHNDYISELEKIRRKYPEVSSVILNINPDPKAPVLGLKNRVLSGAGSIRDQICGVPVEIGPLSFFQVNTPAAEALYRTAAEYADVSPDDSVLDLYCGMGTIGLAVAPGCRQLIGGEIISEAVESARRNAAAMGLTNTRFLCGDAGKIAETLIREKIRPDLIILDPPRRGCSPETLQAVMVSCDPATAARDCRILCDAGYTLTRLRPVDLFPRTKHVETCVLLTHPFMSKS